MKVYLFIWLIILNRSDDNFRIIINYRCYILILDFYRILYYILYKFFEIKMFISIYKVFKNV